MGKALYTYTTQIEAFKTISEIQEILVKHGAKSVMADYTSQGTIESLSFAIATPEGRVMGVKLPCDPNPVYRVLEIQSSEGKVPRRLVTPEQALRVAWRIVFHWVEAQIALLETQMVKMEQIFLPYAIVKDGKTLFEAMKEDKFKLLDAKIETSQTIEGVIER